MRPATAPEPALQLLIYSKDRPAQLELLLRSGEELVAEWDDIAVTVVFTYESPEFRKGYDRVRELHPGVRYVDEHDTGETFKETTLRVLGGAEFTAFLVDDDTFKHPFSIDSEEFRRFAADPEIACLSLRMCPRMDYCYAMDRVTGAPQFEQGTVWRWTDADGDWGYPMSLDGHVFRTHELMPLLETVPFHHPNSLEQELAERPLAAPKAICFHESKIVNVPANRVQDTHQNRHMGLATPEELNERFLAGDRIALEPFKHVVNAGPHHEMELEWEAGGSRPVRTVVFVDELLEQPELAVAYAEAFEGVPGAELVIYAPDADPAEAGGRVAALLAEHSLEGRDLEMTLLAVPAAAGDAALAEGRDALLTTRPLAPVRTEPSVSRQRAIDHVGRDKVTGDPRTWNPFLDDLESYQGLPGAERLELNDLNPQLHDRTPTNPYDGHYFFQDVWAARRVADAKPRRHVDVGSRVDYVGFLTALTDVTFVDIRPLEADIEGLTSVAGSILEMPFEDRSLESVSCLHVAEHIGLGRYGDPLDPLGTRKAAAELQRVVAPGGQLLFALPVGRPRVCFNAHRVHSPHDVVAMFPELELVEFSGVDDTITFRRHRTLDELAGQEYACGMFRFHRPLDHAPPVPEPPSEDAKRAHLLELFRRRGHRLLLESGTYLGGTVAHFLPHAERIVSIEVEPSLYEQACRRFAGDANVELHHGDALDALPPLLAEMDSPPLVWLDGHFSGGVTGVGAEVEPAPSILERLGSTDVPRGTTLVVDDLRLFGRDDTFPSLDELTSRARAAFPGARIYAGLDALVIET